MSAEECGFTGGSRRSQTAATIKDDFCRGLLWDSGRGGRGGKAGEDGGLMMEDGEGQARLVRTLAPPGEKRMIETDWHWTSQIWAEVRAGRAAPPPSQFLN